MLEDDQKFEELESKLAALSSQVEDLEQETEVDPFFEDDVRRVIDDFKSRELAGLESEDEDFDDDDSSSDDFISVQTTAGPSFKTHWIAPTSCDNMTRDLARDAFVQGAADRYGTSQQVNNGDVLILLCREAVAEEPGEGSEAEEPEPPKKICRYVGLAYNTLVHPASTEPPSETEELISAPVGNYEIFVWSSCECSDEPAETVVLPSIFEESTGSTSNGNYASIGDDESPDMSNADGLLTEASLRKSKDTSSSNLAKGLSNTLSKNDAGYKAQLVQLSQDLSRYHLDQKKNQLNFEADKKNLNSHGFGSDLFVSKNLELSNGECGNLETVSISGETFDLALLKEGTPSLGSTFLSTAKISLGTAVSIAGTFNLDVYDTNPVSLDSGLELVTGSTVFLPVITEENADEIANADTLDTSTLALNTPVVTGDGEKFTVSIGTEITTLTANYSSGLLTHKASPVTAAGPTITFSIPDREVSLANLTSLGNAGPAGHYLKELSTIRATGEYDGSGSLDLQVEFDALRSQLNFTQHGLFLNETSPESVTLSVGNIAISPYTIDTFPDLGEERSDALISNISGLSSSIDSSHSNSGDTKINLTGSLQNTNYTFTKGLLTGATVSNASSVSLGSIIVPKPAGTSDDHTPELFKTSVNSGAASSFYQKSVSIFSSGGALIDFTNGLAVSLSNPSYTRIRGLSLDASNNNGTVEATKLSDISVRGIYDVIYESEETGDARYYIDYTYQDITLTIQNGLVTETALGSSTTESKGPINVPGADLKYGCDPEYGCQPDPAGEFFDSSCGSGCVAEELILSYRPSNIWIYTESSYENGEFCFNLESSHESIPAGADLQNQFYTNGGHLKAEKIAGKKVDNFYVNNVLTPENTIYYAEKDPYDVCNAVRFEHSFRRYRENTLDDGSRCWTFISEHIYIPGQGDDRTVICTNNGRVVSKLDALGINVPEYQVNNLPIGQDFYVDSRAGDYNGISIQSTAPGNTENPPLGECSTAAQIDYQASGNSTPSEIDHEDTIVYPKTTSTTDVNVKLTLPNDGYIGSTGMSGVYLGFTNSDGSKLESLEAYPYRGGGNNNGPVEFTIRIPEGSTSLTYEIRLSPIGIPPESFILHLTSQ